MNDPKTMAQAAQMMKDPSFQDQMAKMGEQSGYCWPRPLFPRCRCRSPTYYLTRRAAKDPSFKKYVSAMQEMMQDPATKLKMEQMASAMNTHLEL